jgi:hypothetical protein
MEPAGRWATISGAVPGRGVRGFRVHPDGVIDITLRSAEPKPSMTSIFYALMASSAFLSALGSVGLRGAFGSMSIMR